MHSHLASWGQNKDVNQIYLVLQLTALPPPGARKPLLYFSGLGSRGGPFTGGERVVHQSSWAGLEEGGDLVPQSQE